MPITRSLEKDRSGHPFYVHRVGNRTYPDYEPYVNGDYGELLQKVKDLEIRPDDVIVIGFPKSGNNWVFEVVNMAFYHTAQYTSAKYADKILDLRTLQELDGLKDRPSPRMLFSHLNIDSMPEQIASKRPKVIYLVRNIKDIATSMFNWVHILKKFLPYKGKWEDYLDLEMAGQFCYGSWFDHVWNADWFMRNHPDVPFHVLSYEKLNLTPTEEISKLCHFLGTPDDLAEDMAKNIGFHKMKAAVQNLKFDVWTSEVCEPGTCGIMRKGVVGDWRNHFTEEQSRWFDGVFEEKLKGSSIGNMLRPYMGL